MNQSNLFKFFILILILILIGVITAGVKESYRKYQISREATGFKKEIESLKEENELLSNLLNYLNSEKSLEKEARLKLNLLKEGEKLVIIVPDKKTDSENQLLEDAKNEQASNFEKWWEYLFGVDKQFSL